MEEESEPRNDSHDYSHRRWSTKFRVAFAGLISGIQGPPAGSGMNSFAVHLPIAILVIIAGIGMNVGWTSMLLLVICIGIVFVAELMNTSIEQLAKAITDRPNEHLRVALDVAGGAVLMASLTAAVIGTVVFGMRIVELFGW